MNPVLSCGGSAWPGSVSRRRCTPAPGVPTTALGAQRRAWAPGSERAKDTSRPSATSDGSSAEPP